LLITSSFFGVFYVLQFSMQSMGAAIPALIINISRQGFIYIPMLYVFNSLIGLNGIVLAQPVADIISIILAAFLCLGSYRNVKSSAEARAIPN
jgi:Na+-driven multidrug efflux pump